MTNQNAHLHLTSPETTHLRSASPQSFTSVRAPFSAIFSFDGLSSMVHSLAIKVQASSTPNVSRHAIALLAFEPVTSTNQNSSATIALKPIVEMQVSADSKETCNALGTLAHEHQCLNRTQPIFQWMDVSAFQQSLPIKGACIALARFDEAFKFIVALTSIANFQLIVELFLNPNHEGARAVPITSTLVSDRD
jgi:hypothetical protein